MKKIVFLLLLIPYIATSQKSYLDKDGNPHLWGMIKINDLKKSPYSDWYAASMVNYNLKNQGKIKDGLKDVEVKIYMGTWCGDSKRWVPRFIEQWLELELRTEQLQIIGVHNEDALYKQSPDKSENKYDIHRVPTFVFEKDGKEIGRIVESPVNDLYTDLSQISLGYPTEPRYKGVTYIASILDTLTISVEDEHENMKIARRIYRDVSYVGEMNTYAKKLYTEGRVNEAEWVYHLNTILYKYHPFTHQQMGAFYEKTGRIDEAIEKYYKALTIDPKNQQVISLIHNLNSSKSALNE